MKEFCFILLYFLSFSDTDIITKGRCAYFLIFQESKSNTYLLILSYANHFNSVLIFQRGKWYFFLHFKDDNKHTHTIATESHKAAWAQTLNDYN